jgi:hypothetical protein
MAIRPVDRPCLDATAWRGPQSWARRSTFSSRAPSGQAIRNMNVMFGLRETAALDHRVLFP